MDFHVGWRSVDSNPCHMGPWRPFPVPCPQPPPSPYPSLTANGQIPGSSDLFPPPRHLSLLALLLAQGSVWQRAGPECLGQGESGERERSAGHGPVGSGDEQGTVPLGTESGSGAGGRDLHLTPRNVRRSPHPSPGPYEDTGQPTRVLGCFQKGPVSHRQPH